MRFVLQRATRRNPCRSNSPGTPRPEICSRATATHSGLRVAYLGGALVELAGAMIALVFIRNDSMEHCKR
jgi:hypothetical protein